MATIRMSIHCVSWIGKEKGLPFLGFGFGVDSGFGSFGFLPLFAGAGDSEDGGVTGLGLAVSDLAFATRGHAMNERVMAFDKGYLATLTTRLVATRTENMVVVCQSL
jgi:hypothetical protein